jgi:hypothetical protein
MPCLDKSTTHVQFLLRASLTAAEPAAGLSAEMSFSHEYQFIDGQDKNARKKTRAHVTREYYRERRWQQINAFKSGEEPGALHAPPKCPFVVSVIKLGQDSDDSPDANNRNGSYGSKSSGNRCSYSKPYSKPCQFVEEGEEMTSRALVKASPTTILGAGRVDPFQTFPIEATRDTHLLIDHCMCYRAASLMALPY